MSLPHDQEHAEKAALTNILATLGPSTDSAETLEHMVEAGATLFRLNFSHGTFEDHKKRLDLVRSVEKKIGRALTVLGDLPGPKIRLGTVPGDGIVLETGTDVVIRSDLDEARREGDEVILPCNYERIAAEVKPGERVLINDGAIRMLAVDTDGVSLRCRVTHGDLATTRKGVNLPDSDLTIPALTEVDLKAVDWSVEHGLDFLALSFVRRGQEVLELRKRLAAICTAETCGLAFDGPDSEPRIPIISKIETPQAVRNIEEILDITDGLMVARGDLGVEMDVAEVPIIQKQLIERAHAHGKPCIVATQMLQSMIDSASPTRAEVSDVANAVLDGADTVMLSGETAVGRFPVLTVATMARVLHVTEASLHASEAHSARPPQKPRETRERTWAIAHGTWHMAQDIGAKLVVVWSQSGGTARALSRNGFRCPIVAFSSDIRSVRRMDILYGVTSLHLNEVPQHRSDFAQMADVIILERGWVNRGDPVIFIGGKPLDRPGATNTVAIRYAGELTPGELDDTMMFH
ncbi:MAG: pyruvate kinase [Planctomycetota bacterium]